MKKIKGAETVIIGGGTVDWDISKVIRPSMTVICADHGYDHALRCGIQPDMVIGDMDSVSALVDCGEICRYPSRKDDTDGELAVRTAVDEGAASLLLLGFTGTRMDHTIADILLLRYPAKKGIPAVLMDRTNEIYYLTDQLEIRGRAGEMLSILPLNGDLEGITAEGLEYPLCGDTLYYGKSRGVSNVMTKPVCRITVKSGEGIVLKSRD